MRIQNNIMALNAHRQLGRNSGNVSKSLEKLSSGFRINRAGDDAAGLAISEKMRAQITGLETAQTNSQDGISLVQTAEGALTEVHSMLDRMVELATKSSNGTYMDDDRVKLQKEVDSLNEEIERISQSVNFNRQNLLDGTLGGGSSTVGVAVVAGTSVAIAADSTKTGFTITGAQKGTKFTIDAGTAAGISVASGTIKVSFPAGTEMNQASIDKILKDNAKTLPAGLKITLTGTDSFTTASAAKGSGTAVVTVEDPVKETGASGGMVFESKNAGNYGHVVTITMATDTEGATIDAKGDVVLTLDKNSTYTKDDINKMLGKINAPVVATEFGSPSDKMITLSGGKGAGGVDGTGLILQVGDTSDEYQKLTVSVDDMSPASLGIAGISVSKQDEASQSIKKLNDAVGKVSETRANLGAVQNRLDHTINNLGVTTENLTASESRIRDADMAKEMSTFTKDNVLAQAAQAMLAQANQQPQAVLQLLQ